MRLGRLDLNLLVALDVLLRERKVAEAARQLGLSQSAMSSALGRLRAYFDDELFVLVGRQLTPTDLAKSLEAPVRELLMQAQTRIVARRGFDPAASDRIFTLVASSYLTITYLPRVIQRLTRIAADIRLRLLPLNAEVERELDRGDIDLIILPDAFADPRHPREPLLEDDFVCIAWRLNPEIGETLDLETYRRLGHVACEIGYQRIATLERLARDEGELGGADKIVAGDYTLLPHLIIGTTRIATVQRKLAELYSSFLDLRILAPPAPLPRLKEVMQWHRYQDEDTGHRWLRTLLRREAAGEDNTL